MSWVSSLINTVVKNVEGAEKSAIVSAAKDEIANVIRANGAATEAEAITVVNANIDAITSKALSGVKSPVMAGIIALAEPTVSAWVEGIVDGAVEQVFATVEAEAARLGQGSTTINLAN